MSTLGISWWFIVPIAFLVLAFFMFIMGIANGPDRPPDAAKRFMFAGAGFMLAAAVSFWLTDSRVVAVFCGAVSLYDLYRAIMVER